MAGFVRRLNRREQVLALLLVVAAAVLGWRWIYGSSAVPATSVRSGSQAPLPVVERIDLARLDKPRDVGDAGRRNLFAFGAAAAPAATPPPVVVPVPHPTTAAAPADGSPAGAAGMPSLPPLNVRYIGSVENATGAKVAVLVTDRQEVLTGQPGQVIANRYRVSRIGLESVDLEDVSTGQSRRIPLRGGS
jgi:hypothetical protein